MKYTISVVTGSERGCGTNANVCCCVYGQHGDTGSRPLKQKGRDLFERNQTDEFVLEALDLGELSRLEIGHDNSGFRPGWMLDRVVITSQATNKRWTFPCGQWLDKKREDGKISRSLLCRNQ